MGLIKEGLLQTLEDRKVAGYVELPNGIDWDKEESALAPIKYNLKVLLESTWSHDE